MNKACMAFEVNEKDYTVSFTRFMAMLFIVICHILQFYNNEFAWWFNVGVQMFFLISGYLHANKKINDTIEFLTERFVKILVPYYICVVFICFTSIVLKSGCSLKQITHLLTISGADGFISLAHLWFVPYILMCYLITPIILKFKI